MAQLHLVLAEVALALTALGIAWSAIAVATRRSPGRLYLVNLIWVTVVLAAAGALGLLMLTTGSGPSDGLHVVYGILAVVALPIGASVAQGRDDRERSVIGLVTTVVLVILVLRLFQTGG